MAYIAKDKIVRTGTDVTLATVVNVQNAAGTVAFDRLVKVDRVPLAASDAAGGVLTWANPEADSILVTRVVFDVTTASSAACTLDVGASTTVASSDTLMDGINVAATGIFDNIENQGTNGVSTVKIAAGKYITASKASGAAAGLAGFAYIHYTLI